jgi:hypothetical protein
MEEKYLVSCGQFDEYKGRYGREESLYLKMVNKAKEDLNKSENIIEKLKEKNHNLQDKIN